MSTYTKHVEQYMSTETVIYKDGVEISRQENYDGYILGRDNLWKPIDVGGPGYLTPRMMEALNYRERY